MEWSLLVAQIIKGGSKNSVFSVLLFWNVICTLSKVSFWKFVRSHSPLCSLTNFQKYTSDSAQIPISELLEPPIKQPWAKIIISSDSRCTVSCNHSILSLFFSIWFEWNDYWSFGFSPGRAESSCKAKNLSLICWAYYKGAINKWFILVNCPWMIRKVF